MSELTANGVEVWTNPDLNKIELYGPGPWVDEPDRIEWRFSGLPCLALRGPPMIGQWCGYVGLPPGHPWWGHGYNDVDVDVHGGLTFAGECHGHICHVARPGEPEHVYWLGFDCGHWQDLQPGLVKLCPSLASVRPGLGMDAGVYRTAEYIMSEVENLARQVKARATGA